VLRRGGRNGIKKTSAALEAGLKPMVCVDERLERREAGATEAVLAQQAAGGLAPFDFRAIRLRDHGLRTSLGHRNRQNRNA
jgi:hypothetical protein